MRHQSTLAGVLTASAIAMTVAGCGGSAASDDGGERFTYWSMYKEGEPAQKAIAASIEEFTDQTGIEVDVQWQGRDVLTKLQPTLNGTPAADLIERNLGQTEAIMVSSGTAADMSPVLDMEIPGESRTVGEAIDEKYLSLGMSGDELVLLPYNLSTFGLWYDKSRFPDLAPEDAATWEDFEKVLEESRSSGAPLALDGDIGPYVEFWYDSFVVNRLGVGSLHEAAGDKTGETWDEPGYLEAAERVQSLVEGDFFIDGYDASKFPAIQQKWASGEANFILNGSWLPGETAPYAKEGFEYASIPFPTDGIDQVIAPADAYGWVMPTKAENADAAQQFVAFMYGKDQAQRLVDETQSISSMPEVESGDSMKGAIAMLEQADEVYDPADKIGNDYADWRTVVYTPLLLSLVTGDMDAQEFIDELKAQSVDYWERNG